MIPFKIRDIFSQAIAKYIILLMEIFPKGGIRHEIFDRR